ncbi:MAG: DUF58 domain-containing protein [Caldilineaceae bacterium]|nr:DUF58 domain-containing protein [Caldilineaceae bacterium]
MHPLFWALLLLTLFAALLRQDWIYFLVYIVGGIWLISHWWVRRSLRRLTVHRTFLHRAFVGDEIDVTLHFRNQSWLPIPWLQIREQVPLDLKSIDEYNIVLSVGGKSQGEHHYKLLAKRRGYYAVGPLVLRTGDLFGFTYADWRETNSINVTIYPQVLPLYKVGLPSRSPFGNLSSRQRLFEDPTRLSGVRAYAVGDSLRRIHWKASAHEDNLLVKKFQPAIALDTLIVLDLNRRAYPDKSAFGDSEWAIVVAASLASYAIGQRQPVGLLTNGLDAPTQQQAAPLPIRQGQGHLMAILAALARIQMHEFEQEFADWLPRRINDMPWGTTIILVLPRLDEATLWALHQAYRRGSNVVVLICSPQANFQNIRAQAERLGVKVHRSVWESELRALEGMGQ